MLQTIRKHAIVKGKVQGVGFRAFTQYKASKLGVVGWVRNLDYDQVEIEAQGQADVLEAFFAEVQKGPSASKVEEIKSEDLEIIAEYRGFQIRHSR